MHRKRKVCIYWIDNVFLRKGHAKRDSGSLDGEKHVSGQLCSKVFGVASFFWTDYEGTFLISKGWVYSREPFFFESSNVKFAL